MKAPSQTAAFSAQRGAMIESQLRARGIRDERVLGAMAKVPREDFAPEKYRDQAYEDHPLPIGEGQTLSQPYIVALMLEALRLRPSDKVLEVGTGSGYVTAILAEITNEVFSIERIASLAERARERMIQMGYTNVSVITGDGTRGYAAEAPYDAIVVSAAAISVPRELFDQLAEIGRMIIPVGHNDNQQLQLIEKREGEPHVTYRELCRFVPLVPGDPRL